METNKLKEIANALNKELSSVVSASIIKLKDMGVLKTKEDEVKYSSVTLELVDAIFKCQTLYFIEIQKLFYSDDITKN